MDVLNRKVSHGQFGDGTVTGQTDTMVTVQFSGDAGEKKFLYPAGFEAFLTLCDAADKLEMELEIKAIHDKTDAEHRMREEADRQRLNEERRILLEQKKKKRAPAKKATAKPKKAEPEEEAE